MTFDLMATVEHGGCSAKLAAGKLSEALARLPRVTHPDLLVDIETHDDAGVFRISSECALIQTVDFFPPVCSDPYQFGRIAAANALSDVYAMGGEVLTALNIAMFPSSQAPIEVLEEILRGGQETVAEAGGVVVGGHTIDDYPPKYGLAVTGTVHPRRVVTNAAAQPGQRLVLTKPIGTGTVVAGKRVGETGVADYDKALDTMMQLNRSGAEVMKEMGVQCATDVTGFGLAGHALKMARASGVSIVLRTGLVPLLGGAYGLVELGCIPGGAFRNQEFVETDCRFLPQLDYNLRMLALDPQTSGGLLMCVRPEDLDTAIDKLKSRGCLHAACIGEVVPRGDTSLIVE